MTDLVDGGAVAATFPDPCEIDLDFDATPVRRAATATIQIDNLGVSPLEVSQVIATLDPAFDLNYGTPTPVQPQQFYPFTVTFKPDHLGQVQSMFTIQTNGENDQCPAPRGSSPGDVITVMLTGSGS